MYDLGIYIEEFVKLSGLEGTTINEICESLQKRNPYLEFTDISVDTSLKTYMIEVLLKIDNIKVYSLSKIQKANKQNKKPKLFCPYFVCDLETKTFGFCQNYKYRQEITANLLYIDICTTSSDYIFVASQRDRENILSYPNVSEINYFEYSTLEIISRSMHKGFPQENLVMYKLDSSRTHYMINRLIKNRNLIKLRFKCASQEIPNNLLLLPRFYNLNKIPVILYISHKSLEVAPYDIYIITIFDIISKSSGNIRKTFNSLLSIHNVGILEFKNCLYYLCKSGYVKVTRNGVKIDRVELSKLFPFNRKILGDDKIEFYSDLWLESINHDNWELVLSKYDPDVLFGLEADSKNFSNENSILDVNFNVPFERSLLTHLNDLIIKYSPKGVSIKNLRDITGLGFGLLEKYLNFLEKRKSISSKTIIEENRRFRRFISSFLNNLNVLSEIETSQNDQICSINLIPFIDNLPHNMMRKKINLKKPYFLIRLKFIISYFENNFLCLPKIEVVFPCLNEWEKINNERTSSEEFFTRLINDLIMAKVIKLLKLFVKYLGERHILRVYAIWTDELKADFSNIAKLFTNQLKDLGVCENILEDDSLADKIARRIKNHNVLVIKNVVKEKKYENIIDWQEEQYAFLNLANSYYIQSGYAIPRFFKLKMLHIFLAKAVLNLTWTNMDHSISSSDPFMNLFWISHVNTMEKTKDRWFSMRESFFQLPLILFICLIASNLQKEIKSHFIEKKSQYLLPIKYVIDNNKPDNDIYIKKYFGYFNKLFAMRLLGGNKTILCNDDKKIYFNILDKTSIYDNKDSESAEEIPYLFNDLDDMIKFWNDLELLSKNKAFSLVGRSKKDRTQYLYMKKYISDHTASDPNKLIQSHIQPELPLGYCKFLQITLNNNWKFKSVLYPIHSETIDRNLLKRKTAAEEKQEKCKRSIKDLKLCFSNSTEQLILISYILYRLKYQNIHLFYHYLKPELEKRAILVYKKKEISKLFYKISRHKEFQILTKQIIKYFITENNIAIAGSSTKTKLGDQLDLIYNEIEIIHLNDHTLNYLKSNFDILYLYEIEKPNMIAPKLGISANNSSEIFRRVLFIHILNKCCSLEIPQSALKDLYEISDYNVVTKSFRYFLRIGIFKKFIRAQLVDAFAINNFENFLKIYHAFMANIQTRLISIFMQAKNQLPAIPIIINSELLYYMIENHLNSNIQFQCRYICPEGCIILNMDNFNSINYHIPDKDMLFIPKQMELFIKPGVKSLRTTFSKKFLIDIMCQILVYKVASKIYTSNFNKDFLNSYISKIDPTKNNSENNIKIFSDIMANFQLPYKETNEIYQEMLKIKCIENNLNIPKEVIDNSEDVYFQNVIKLPVNFYNNFKIFSEQYVFKIIEKHPGITQNDIIQKGGKTIPSADILIALESLKCSNKISEFSIPQRKRLFYPLDNCVASYICNIIY